MARTEVAHEHHLARSPGRVWCSTCPLDLRWPDEPGDPPPPDFGGFCMGTWTRADPGE